MGKGKKSPPTYVENVDFLVGSNPIQHIMQIWRNQTDNFPLNFTRVKLAVGGAGSTVTVSDPYFYFVIGVTAEVVMSASFNDYGGPGPISFTSVTQEYPMWNAALHGPDLIDPNALRITGKTSVSGSSRWPAFYQWRKGDGPNIAFPMGGMKNAVNFSPTGFVYIYYAQLSAAIGHESPLSRLFLEFEEQLGNDPFVYAPAPSQQITYPQYAGVGSTAIDLGTAGVLPSLRPEVLGSYSYFPSGDAEFADMIEDIIKSGAIQTGLAFGQIQRGCNCNDLPGVIQKAYNNIAAVGITSLLYQQQNNPGSILLAAAFLNTGAPAIADIAGNSWIPIFSASGGGFWYVNGCVAAAAATNFVSMTPSPNINGVILEMDPGFSALDGSPTSNSGSTPFASGSITTSGPAYIVAICAGTFDSEAISKHWTDLIGVDPNANLLVLGRYVAGPGTYTVQFNTHSGSPWQIGMIALKAPQPVGYPKTLGDIIDFDTMFNARLQGRAGGLYGSLSMDSQKNASDWLKDIYMAFNTAPLWSGFKLKSIARSEASLLGQANIFVSPTASGPVATLTESDLIGDASTPLITVKRKAQVDANNVIQLQYLDRTNRYNPATASQPESGSIALYGPRKDAPIVLNMINDSKIARKVLAIQVRRNIYLRNTYQFKAQAKWLGLEAMDLVLINESKIGISNLAVRLTKVVENDNLELECEAEPFIYGVHSPDTLAATLPQPFLPNFNAEVASINTPIFLEPVPKLLSSSSQGTTSSPQQLWIVVSCSDPNFGGAVVLISTDGGSSYNALGQTAGNAVTGLSTADWPIANDPDTTNDLLLDLSESLGTLSSYQVADEDAFTYPCYIAGGAGAIPYELMTYAVATLTSANHYTLKATGGGTNHLRRSVFGAPTPGVGVDHPLGTRWAFLNPVGTGIFKVNMDPKWIGKTLHFKFLSFNTFGGGVEDQSAATDYTYTPTGVAQSQSPNAFNYTITGGALTNPTSTTIHMAQATAHFPSGDANYNARTFTISAPSVPTLYYVTIADPAFLGDTGTGTNLTATCQTSNALVGVAGNTYIGSITALPAGGGTVTGGGGVPLSGANPYDVIFSFPGKPPTGTTYSIITFSRIVTFPGNFVGSVGKVLTNPAATATFTLLKNGGSVGTVVVATSGAFTFTSSGGSPVIFTPGDYLEITTPSPQDTTLSDFEVTLSGTR